MGIGTNTVVIIFNHYFTLPFIKIELSETNLYGDPLIFLTNNFLHNIDFENF